MIWKSIETELSDGVRDYRILRECADKPMTFAEVVDLWSAETDDGALFRDFTTSGLITSLFSAFRWETPSVSRSSFDREFEFVILDSPGLERRQSAREFRSHFEANTTKESVITFPNIGGNAILVVPCPLEVDQQNRSERKLPSPDSNQEARPNYCHFASFLRTAPRHQTDRIWREVSLALKGRVSDKPVWLSTAGGGVAWLHIRLDDRPKYYAHQPFKAS